MTNKEFMAIQGAIWVLEDEIDRLANRNICGQGEKISYGEAINILMGMLSEEVRK